MTQGGGGAGSGVGVQRVAILGATGRTGRHLLLLAREKHLDASILARSPMALGETQKELTVVQGSSTDPDALGSVVVGCDAVISAVGRVRGSPPDLMTLTASALVSVMTRQRVRRLVVLTNTAVGDPQDKPPPAHKLLRFALGIVNGPLKRDSAIAAAVVSESTLDWTLVRAPVLTDGARTGNYRVGPLVKGMPLRVSRADVADFMLACALSDRFCRQRPAIGGAGSRK